MLHLPWIFSHVCIRKSNRKEVIRMAKKPQYKESKERMDRKASELYSDVHDRILKVRYALKQMYVVAPPEEEEKIHYLGKELDSVRHTVWRLLIKGDTPMKILRVK
jgi:hypothetical protein